MKKLDLNASKILLILLFVFLTIIIMFPFYAIVISSFKPSKDVIRKGLNVDWDLVNMSFSNYKSLFDGSSKYFTWFKNSLIITALQTVTTLAVSACVGYGFAMYNFKFKNVLFTCVLIVMMIPVEILMLPLYQLLINVKLIDTYMGIILPFVAAPLPIFFFRQYLTGIPKELMDAGRVDGCTEYGIFAKIILPLMAPAFASMGIFVGMSSWNGFLWPLLVLRSETKFTLPIGLNTLITPYGNNYDILIAGSVFSIIPILILFFFFQKYFIAGMTSGGVKG